MKIRNLISSVLVSSSLVLPLAATATAQADGGVNLNDLDGPSVYAKNEIQFLSQNGIITGYEDGTYRPGNTMDRQEFAAILTRSLELTEDASASTQFTDVPEWSRGYVGALVKAGITTGVSSTQFDASAPVTRQDLAVFMMRAMGYEKLAKDVNLSSDFADFNQVWDYAKADVAMSQQIGFIRGQQDSASAPLVFAPNENAQRQAVARLVYELYTNGQKYKTQLDAIQKTDSVLTDSANAMGQLSSVEMSVYQQGPKDAVLESTVDTIKDPLTSHMSMKVTVGSSVYNTVGGSVYNTVGGSVYNTVGNSVYNTVGNSVYNTVGSNVYNTEIYYKDGFDYLLDPNSKWTKRFVGDRQPLTQTKPGQAHTATPYLTLTDNGDTYVLKGTFDQQLLTKLLANSNLINLPEQDLSQVQKVEYTFTIDQKTMYETSVSYVATLMSGDTATGTITFEKFNDVAPIQIPQDALNAQ